MCRLHTDRSQWDLVKTVLMRHDAGSALFVQQCLDSGQQACSWDLVPIYNSRGSWQLGTFLKVAKGFVKGKRAHTLKRDLDVACDTYL